MSQLQDRQFLVSPEPPTTVGVITTATNNTFDCSVYFRGETFRCKSAGKNHLALNDLVSFWEIDGLYFCAKYSAGYPTRFKRPLADWFPTHKYNALLQTMLKNAEKTYTYRLGVVESIASASSLIVACWDGVSREIPVEYSGEVKNSSSFFVGDPIVCYNKNLIQWVVIGKLAKITATPDSFDFGNVQCVIGSSPEILVIVQDGSLSAITVTAPDHFKVSSGGSYSSSVIISSSGGSIGIKLIPTTKGPKSGVISVVSADASKNISVSGIGIANIQTVPQTISFGSVRIGEASTPRAIAVSGNGTTESLTVAGTEIFKISNSLSGPFFDSLSFPSAGGTVYAILEPESIGEKSGTITISNAEASASVAVSGTGINRLRCVIYYPSGTWNGAGLASWTTEEKNELGSFSFPGPSLDFSERSTISVTGQASLPDAPGIKATITFGPYSYVIRNGEVASMSAAVWSGEGEQPPGTITYSPSTTVVIENDD